MTTFHVAVAENVTRRYTVEIPEEVAGDLNSEQLIDAAEDQVTSGNFLNVVDTGADIVGILSVTREDESQ